MGRIKQGGPGQLYYDANDSGIDQGSPDDIAKFKASNPNYAGTSPVSPTSGSGAMAYSGGTSSDGPVPAPTAPSYPTTPTSPQFEEYGGYQFDPNANYQQNYGAPDREAVLRVWEQWQQARNAAANGEQGPTDAERLAAQQRGGVTGNGAGAGAGTTPGSWPAQAPEGYDQTKWNDPSVATPKYVFGRIYAATGNIQEAAAAIGATVVGTDKISYQGAVFDVNRDQEGANAQQWTQLGAGGGAGTGAGGLGGDGHDGTGAGGTEAQNALRTALETALQQLISQNSGDSLGDVSATPQAQAFGLANQRSAESLRSMLAERLSTEGVGNVEGGGTSGAFDSDMIGVERGRGEAQMQYEGQLAERMLTEKKDRLTQALQMGAAYLSDQQRIQLQSELQRLNSALEMARMAQQNTQFYDDLGYRIGVTEAGLNRDALGAAS